MASSPMNCSMLASGTELHHVKEHRTLYSPVCHTKLQWRRSPKYPEEQDLVSVTTRGSERIKVDLTYVPHQS